MLSYENLQEMYLKLLQQYNLIISEGSIDWIDYVFMLSEMEELKFYDV